MKNIKKNNGIVFSTNPDFKFEEESNEQETLSAKEQKLYVRLDRLKGGKVATVVENYIANDTNFNALAKELKAKCGVGGTAKDGEIILQGDHREKVVGLLVTKGFAVKKKGG
jgi:translation initiation factor 1